MDFGLSEEQELLQATVRGFTANETPPAKVREIFDGDESYDQAVWQGMVEMGLAGLVIPEASRWGGDGRCSISRSSPRCSVPRRYRAPTSVTPWPGSRSHGGRQRCARRTRWLPRLATGEVVATVALGEDGDVWDPDAWQLSRCRAASSSG